MNIIAFVNIEDHLGEVLTVIFSITSGVLTLVGLISIFVSMNSQHTIQKCREIIWDLIDLPNAYKSLKDITYTFVYDRLKNQNKIRDELTRKFDLYEQLVDTKDTFTEKIIIVASETLLFVWIIWFIVIMLLLTQLSSVWLVITFISFVIITYLFFGFYQIIRKLNNPIKISNLPALNEIYNAESVVSKVPILKLAAMNMKIKPFETYISDNLVFNEELNGSIFILEAEMVLPVYNFQVMADITWRPIDPVSGKEDLSAFTIIYPNYTGFLLKGEHLIIHPHNSLYTNEPLESIKGLNEEPDYDGNIGTDSFRHITSISKLNGYFVCWFVMPESDKESIIRITLYLKGKKEEPVISVDYEWNRNFVKTPESLEPINIAEINNDVKCDVKPKRLVSKIAFINDLDLSNIDIYVMNENCSLTCLTNNNFIVDPFAVPAWSPDGTKITFVSLREGNKEIHVINADGSICSDFTNDSVSGSYPVWSPDGTKIAFISQREEAAGIYMMDTNGSNPTCLTNNKFKIDDYAPAWSPDGKKIAFIRSLGEDTEIYVMNADGSNPACLINNEADYNALSWSPDGKRIAFTSYKEGNSEIYVMNDDGSSPTLLSNHGPYKEAPVWSPNGKKIAFSSYRNNKYSEIYVMNDDGSNQTNLTNDPNENDYAPAWSPDGKKIAFISSIPRCPATIHVMNSDGSDPETLTRSPIRSYGLTWCPLIRL